MNPTHGGWKSRGTYSAEELGHRHLNFLVFKRRELPRTARNLPPFYAQIAVAALPVHQADKEMCLM